MKDRKEADSRQEHDLLKANQEKLFAQLKADMIASMTSSMKTLEKEMSQIKGEQNKLQDIGQRSTSEQRVLEEKLRSSEKLLHEYREQWTVQLHSHSQKIDSVVERSVADAIGKSRGEQEKRMDE